MEGWVVISVTECSVVGLEEITSPVHDISTPEDDVRLWQEDDNLNKLQVFIINVQSKPTTFGVCYPRNKVFMRVQLPFIKMK